MEPTTTAFGRPFCADPRKWKYEYEGKRAVPMEVLVLGPPRTGTSSMSAALKVLGYNDVYHMSSCISNPPDSVVWRRAVRAKWFGQGKVFARENWDLLLGDCMAVTDFPCAAFAEELIAAYPEAKVILNHRPVDAWYRSVNDTIGATLRDPLLRLLAWSGDPFWSIFRPMTNDLWSGFFGVAPGEDLMDEQQCKRRYREHYDSVRRLVPKERLLEVQIGEGWDRMCEFLGKKLPKVPYPRVNDKEEFAKSIGVMVAAGISRLAWKIAKGAIAVGGFTAGAWLLRSQLAEAVAL